jgi:hypothetical protein
MNDERRRRRANSLGESLNYQLAACVEDEGLSAMVVADGDGLRVASWGDDDVCDEIAGRAPIGGVPEARRVRFGGIDLYVCAVGGDATGRKRSLDRSAGGVVRILTTWLVPSS